MFESRSRVLSRRRFVGVLLAASAGSLLQACGPASPAAPTAAPASVATAAPTKPSAPASPAAAAPPASSPSTTPLAPSPAAKPAAAASPVTASAAAPSGPPPTGQTSIRFADDADSLLAGVAGSARSSWIFSTVANGLTRLHQPDLAVDKDLATDWSVSSDGKTYTFTLASNATWHDGQPFSADDVVFTYQLFSHATRPGPLPPDLAVIEGAAAFKSGQAQSISGIKVVSPNQLTFTLTQASNMFLAVTAIRKILPQHLLKDTPPADIDKSVFARKPVYTGPFKIDEWKSGESITLTAYPQSFAGAPRLNQIIIRPIPDPATAIATLQTNGVQLSDVAPDQFGTFSSDSSYKTMQLAGLLSWYLQFNMTNPMFADVAVREAIGHAIDRQTIIDSLLSGKAELSTGIASPTAWLFDPTLPVLDYNPDKSRSMLDAAGWSAGSDGVRTKGDMRLDFKLMDIVRTNDWALAMQPMLQAIGATFTIEQVEFGTWISRMAQKQYDTTIGGWNNGLFDPRGDLQAHFQTGRATDGTGYSNPQVDQLFKQALTLTDRDQEKQIYSQIQQLVAKDVVYVPLFRPQDLYAVRSGLNIPSVTTTPEMYDRAREWTAGAP
jgi:peptide/nickel transport system substrate-binding protein